VVATLGDVVRYAGGYNSCYACHMWRIAETRCLSYTVPRTPYCFSKLSEVEMRPFGYTRYV
jgi:hypothetical protein